MSEPLRAGMCLIGGDAATDGEIRRQREELTTILERLVVGYEWDAAMMALLSCAVERLKEHGQPLDEWLELLSILMDEEDATATSESRTP
jgi:hypothetical protein